MDKQVTFPELLGLQIEREEKHTGVDRDEVLRQVELFLHRHEIDSALTQSDKDIAAGRVSDSDTTWNEVFASLEDE